jgi:signal transduction histidine kinase
MGSRGRSIRLRIYFLVAIPLVTLVGLFADVAYSSVANFVNLDRAPSLIRTTSEPMAYFLSTLQAERRAAFVYQSAPTAASKAGYQAAIAATDSANPSQQGPHGLGYLEAAVNSPGTKRVATPAETRAIESLLGALTGGPLTRLRQGVNAGALPPLTAFKDYTQIVEAIPAVFQAEASSVTAGAAATQGLGLISTISAREEIDQQDALLAGALAAGTLTPDERVAFASSAGREQVDQAVAQATLSSAEYAAYTGAFNSFSGGAAKALEPTRAQVQNAVAAGLPLQTLERSGLTPAKWQQLNQLVSAANFSGGLATANAELAADQALANSARTTVIVTGAIGLLGLVLSLILTILLARSINQRLATLRRQALVLAQEHLPAVVARLRRGEPVDVDVEAAPLRVGNDEIGQVGQAFEAVRLTAITSAVEEARLRQGVNDVFRNLARRNQSLLQRQLTSLDQMERKATDPEVLEDLFKLDHLTTRMRRHAEGLIILSGAPPGRGWSAPVRLIDVMRGAVSEVEDYARVQVATQSRAALSGSAVTDVIHLLAELIENATSFSPPYTQVRVSGEPVTNGFVIEIEDRGLGLTRERLAELNDRLANPPDVNPANTEQLGLFVVAQLARRHGIQVTLRTSPYGGSTAVTLIPRGLVADDAPAALATGANPALQAGPAQAALPSFTPATGVAGGGPANGSANGHGRAYGAGHTGAAPPGSRRDRDAGYPDTVAGSPPDLGAIGLGNGSGPPERDGAGYQSGGRPGGDYQRRDGASWPPAARPGAAGGPWGGPHPDEEHVVTGVPVPKNSAPRFDVFAPAARPGGAPETAPGQVGGPATPGRPAHDAGYGNIEPNAGGYPGDNTSDGGAPAGLPRRVRQASLAPQLRDSGARGPGAGPAEAGAGVPQATAASLADMKNALSAMQRGWQQGRSQPVHRDTGGNSDGA